MIRNDKRMDCTTHIGIYGLFRAVLSGTFGMRKLFVMWRPDQTLNKLEISRESLARFKAYPCFFKLPHFRSIISKYFSFYLRYPDIFKIIFNLVKLILENLIKVIQEYSPCEINTNKILNMGSSIREKVSLSSGGNPHLPAHEPSVLTTRPQRPTVCTSLFECDSHNTSLLKLIRKQAEFLHYISNIQEYTTKFHSDDISAHSVSIHKTQIRKIVNGYISGRHQSYDKSGTNNRKNLQKFAKSLKIPQARTRSFHKYRKKQYQLNVGLNILSTEMSCRMLWHFTMRNECPLDISYFKLDEFDILSGKTIKKSLEKVKQISHHSTQSSTVFKQ
ncbi:hypothetical protein GQR58_008448 [Nymphon striatum]|nr:hypothetical protein GQR58_008448 [Nymphon striatum]